jgi:glycosyltransferase involved in cell wall biosynthesis
MGFVGWRIARSLKVPLVISEHWSRYFPENNNWHGFPEKLMTRFVLSRSSAVIAVSQILKDAMQKCGLTHRAFPVIPNVVDLALQPDEITQERTGLKTFLHISCFEDRSKNISGFLRAVKDLSEKRSDFQCLLVGTGPDWDNMREYAAFLQLPEDRVAFTGLKTGEAFASFMKEADFTVLSSNYETFGTVVVESLACGLPVVATLVGIAPEVIGKANGILVPAGDEHAMTAALNRMLDDCRLYDKVLIKNELADRFSRNTVGRKIMEVYLSLVGQPAGK